jgi:hypothetical protein
MLKPQHGIVGVAHGDDLAAGVPRPPLLDPQIEDVVQEDVGQQRRDCRPLGRGLP